MKLIDIKNIKKYYQLGGSAGHTVKALDDVSLTIARGEYIAIVGPSGSGKSTLLQILGLLDQPTSGQYTFLGHSTKHLPDDKVTLLRSKYIGFIFQLFNLLPRVSVLENAMLPQVYRGTALQKNKVKNILASLRMDKHLSHTPSQLSGGQQQRVAVGRALVNDPQIIFADEPTGNLPQKQAKEIIEELESLHEQGITVVIITHDDEIAKRANRIIRIVDGKIVQDEIQNKPRSIEKTHEDKEIDLTRRKGINILLWKDTIRISLQSLLRNKVRTLLTMLGIIIGVFSVVSMLAIGEGAKSSMEFSLRRMGTNMVRIKSQRPYSKNATKRKIRFTRLNDQDLEALQKLRDSTGLISTLTPALTGKVAATYQGKKIVSYVEGVGTDYERMRGNTPVVGRFFTTGELKNLERVCLIGQTVYQALFGKNENPVGKILKINDKNYRIIGLLPSKGANFGGDLDEVILIPYTTAMKRLLGGKSFHFIFAQASNDQRMDEAMKAITRTLRQSHGIKEGKPDDFSIKNYDEIKKTIEKTLNTMGSFIGIVALISLLVGGIGIMNIMLVSVTERTREIGIRKAIGARSRDILGQFMIESVLISVFGGIVGLICSLLLGGFLRSYMDWAIEFRLYAVLLAFIFSFVVGVFFGIYPARKAAKLSPINALRYE